MKSLKNNSYWDKVSTIADGITSLTNEWLIPHEIDDVDLLHLLGDNKEKVVSGFSLLTMAMLKTAEIHGVSESETTADIWNLMLAEDNHESDSKSSVSRPN